MASYDEVMTALRNADASGNVEDARQLAQIAARMKQEPAPQQAPSTISKIRDYALSNPLFNPLGVAGEQSARISDAVGSGITEGMSRMGASPESSAVAGTAANLATGMGVAAGAGKLATTAAPILKSAATKLMTKAVKPAKADLLSGDAGKAIQTMLDEGIAATEGGLLKLRVKINDLNDEIKDAIRNSPATVDKMTTYKNVKDVLDRFRKQVNPRSDTKAIKDAWDEFKAEWPDIIPVQLAQELKQGTYRALSNKYGEVGSAAEETQKAIARSLKEQIASVVPGVGGLNAQESTLINALEVARRGGVLTAGNKNVLGLGALVDPRAWPMWLADRSPAAMSYLARFLNSQSENIPNAAVGTGVAAGEALLNRK